MPLTNEHNNMQDGNLEKGEERRVVQILNYLLQHPVLPSVPVVVVTTTTSTLH